MVIVEFFGQSPIDNMVSAVTNAPDTVVFVGDVKIMKKYDATFRRFLDSVGNHVTRLEYRSIRVHELHEIVKTLEQIVADYPDCHFDITGGDPMSMAAIGVVYERYRDQGIELHQYNIRSGKVYDCDLNGIVVSGEIPPMTVEQNIILHGGSVVTSELRESGTYSWRFDEEFLRDISVMWEICRKNCGVWNRQITMLDDMRQFNEESSDSLRLRAPLSALESYLMVRGVPMDLTRVFDELEKKGLLLDVERENGYFSLRFKNEQIRRCLTKAGTILELVTCMTAKRTMRKNGMPCFDHISTGVFIDWDGVVHDQSSEYVDTENEIDVVLMHGMIPVFVSCKNGAVGEDELYKLNTVADRFGGAYVKKVLVCTTLGKGGRGKRYFLERAKDMKIQVIEGVHSMPEKEFMKQLRQLV